MGHQHQKAVVLGAGIAGLLAARVLAEQYQTVTIVERDHLSDDPTSRRGVGQGRHPHALLGKATEIIGELFPGIFDQLVADGAVKWDDGDLSRFWSVFAGHLTVRSATLPDPASLTNYHLSQPLLELAVRRAVRELPNVEFLEEHDIIGIVTDDHGGHVIGARVHKHGTQDQSVTAADLVVDATGRGSRMPVFLEELGYPGPPVDEVVVQTVYASVPVRIPAGTLCELVVSRYPTPSRSTMCGVFACENSMYMVVGGAICGQEPPTDRAELLDFVAALTPDHIGAALRSAEPLGEVAQYRVPSNRWRRYDKLLRMPPGLLAFGDAICSFNPIYGQGITVAALEAEALRDCLRKRDSDVPRTFYRESAKKIRVAWRTAVSTDLALPQVGGRRPLSVRAMNAYMKRVLITTETDPLVFQQFFRVLWMLDKPRALFHPRVLRRIATASLTGRRNPERLESTERLQGAGTI